MGRYLLGLHWEEPPLPLWVGGLTGQIPCTAVWQNGSVYPLTSRVWGFNPGVAALFVVTPNQEPPSYHWLNISCSL